MSSRLAKILIVIAGVVLGQVVLYGPCLVGRKVLLPVDILAAPQIYLPRTSETSAIVPQNLFQSDLVLLFEPDRRFVAAEFRAGRFPMWAPYRFAGAPLLWPKFSPFCLLASCTLSPLILAWAQLVAALVAGLGAWLFFERALGLSFWPAAIISWCYPLTGFFIFWQGYPTAYAVYWFPWLLLAVDRIARGSSSAAPIALSLATGLVLVSGHLDVAGQVLLASGLYGVFRLVERAATPDGRHGATKAALRLAAGWALGFLLAAPQILPALDYTRTSARMEQRSSGTEERPPVGLSALPQAVLPDLYGRMSPGSIRLSDDLQMESSAAAYCGLGAALLLAPLAWCSRRHRWPNAFWLGIFILALGWCVNLPGLVQLLRLPGLNLMSHNRLVFIACFAVLALAATGLDVLWNGKAQWRKGFWIPAAFLVALGLWCLYCAVAPPEPLAGELERIISQGGRFAWVHDLPGVREAQAGYLQQCLLSAALCLLCLLGWLIVRQRTSWQTSLVPAMAAFLLADLLCFAHGRSAQCAPALYYPPVPVLQQVARSAPGRVMGFNCLPANLPSVCGLNDVRGYDGVDPARLVQLLSRAGDSPFPPQPFALTQWLAPALSFTQEGAVRLPPILDLLGVRYVVGRGSPPTGAHPALQGEDYWVLENSNALPRLFIPSRVESVSDPVTHPGKLTAPDFNPRQVAFVEAPVDLPPVCAGSAEVIDETPTRIRARLRMESPGLVLMTDRWDTGWQAFLDGKPTPILKTDYALRGVVVPRDAQMLEFRYAPSSFRWGIYLACAAAAVLLLWTCLRFLPKSPSFR